MEAKAKRYVRFMSFEEFEKFITGQVLENCTDWRKQGQCTDSVGFCFFDDSVPPEERIEYLTGVVTMEAVVVFERLSDEPMRKSQGRYRDQEADEDIFNPLAPIPMMKVDEYSVESYSREDMRLVRLGEVTSPIERKINWWKRV